MIVHLTPVRGNLRIRSFHWFLNTKKTSPTAISKRYQQNSINMTTQNQATTRRTRTRWSDNESRHLSLCWIQISEDPVVGDNQTEAKFYERILEEFGKPGQTQRTWKALKDRWH